MPSMRGSAWPSEGEGGGERRGRAMLEAPGAPFPLHGAEPLAWEGVRRGHLVTAPMPQPCGSSDTLCTEATLQAEPEAPAGRPMLMGHPCGEQHRRQPPLLPPPAPASARPRVVRPGCEQTQLPMARSTWRSRTPSLKGCQSARRQACQDRRGSGHQESDFTEGRGGGYAQTGSAEEPRHAQMAGDRAREASGCHHHGLPGEAQGQGHRPWNGAAWV